MKTIPAALQAHYDLGGTSVSNAIAIRRQDGQEFGFTSCDVPFSMDVSTWGFSATGELEFNASQGLSASTVVTTGGFNVDNLELTTLDDGTFFDRDEIMAGVWRDAFYVIFRYRNDVADPSVGNDVEVLNSGTFGNIDIMSAEIKVELRGLAQRPQQQVGLPSSRTCRARLGSTTGSSKCLKPLGSFQHELTVTSVTDNRTFTCSGATQPDDYFGGGVIRWNSGDNTLIEMKVRSHNTGGVFTLLFPTVFDIQVGDTLTATAGCRKTLAICKSKFNNVLNFQGEPHRKTTDDLTRT